jgi:Mg-chelatase subunit ChlD
MIKSIKLCAGLTLGLAVFGLLAQADVQASGPAKKKVKKSAPRVEVVFCLDTTGSMGGLIEGAKQKIWSLCNQIAGGQPTPELKVGLVAYRDRGDAYVTKVYDLTSDLDAVHEHLMSFQAAGGGDEPESVNEALRVALDKIQWSTSKKVLRLVYLVGDAPPHMDYANDVPYTVTCKEACQRGIIINTIQCGNLQATTPYWREIAQLAEGRFVQIAQDGQVQTVSTPFDTRLAEINTALAKTAVPYGDAATRTAATAKLTAAAAPVMTASAGTYSSSTLSPPMTWGAVPAGAYSGASRIQFAPVFVSPTMQWAVPNSAMTGPPLSGAAPTASYSSLPLPCSPCAVTTIATAADRAGYCAKTGKVSALDLLTSIKEGKVRLEDLKTDQLPEEMQKLTLAERRAYLAKMEKDRARLQEEALRLDRQRTEYINRELRRTGGQSSFDGQVMDILRDQAKRIKVAY